MKDILAIFALTVDGRGLHGDVEDFTPPPLKLKMEEMKNGGMDMAVKIEMGMEAMTASFTLTKYDANIRSLFGASGISFTGRGSLRSVDSTVEKPVLINLRGTLSELDSGAWKSGEMAKLKCTIECSYYKETVDGSVITEIDPRNMVRIIGGEDQIESRRRNLAI